jgi:hypothetical protein
MLCRLSVDRQVIVSLVYWIWVCSSLPGLVTGSFQIMPERLSHWAVTSQQVISAAWTASNAVSSPAGHLSVMTRAELPYLNQASCLQPLYRCKRR